MTRADLLRRMPDRVMVGPIPYSIELVDEPSDPDPEAASDPELRDLNILGYCHNSTSRIELRRTVSLPQLVMVCLHEILHAAWFVYDMQPPPKAGNIEEEMVESFTLVISLLIKDNPELMAWMQEVLSAD